LQQPEFLPKQIRFSSQNTTGIFSFHLKNERNGYLQILTFQGLKGVVFHIKRISSGVYRISPLALFSFICTELKSYKI